MTAIVLLALAIPTMVLPRLPAQVRSATEWRFSHEVRPPQDWRITYRTIEPEQELTSLSLPGPGAERTSCLITVATTAADEPAKESGGRTTPTTVGGRPGELLDQGGNDLILAWQYADRAWATVQCWNRSVPAATLQRIAATVRFRDGRQLLPFMLDTLPDGYRIQIVGESFEDPEWGPFLVLSPPDDSYWPIVMIGPTTSDTDADTARERCLDPNRNVCVSAAPSDDQVPVDTGIERGVLATVVGDVRLAPDITDRAGWFDATGLPR